MFRRLSFLPAFFIVLGIAFVIAAAVRIRSYSDETATSHGSAIDGGVQTSEANARLTPDATASGGVSVVMPGSEGEATGTIVSENPTDPRRVSNREQRYNELLKAP